MYAQKGLLFMTWPRFGYRLCVCACIAMLCGIRTADAQNGPGYYLGQQQEEAKQARETAGDINSKVKTDGACELDDNAKKEMAKKAAQAMKETRNALIEFNKQMMKSFNEGGACHYLDNRLTDGTLSDDAARYDLLFTDYSRAGAQNADKLYPNGKTGALLAEYEKKLTYAGINPKKILARSGKGNTEVDKMLQWSRTAKKGSTFQINEATSELLEEAFGFKVDCNYAIMTDDSGSFSCYQINSADGEAFNNAVNNSTDTSITSAVKGLFTGKTWVEGFNYLVSVTGGGAVELLKQTGAITAFSCTKTKCSKGDDSFLDIINNLSVKAQECSDEIQSAIQKRSEIINKRKEAHELLAVLSGNLDIQCTCEMREVDGEMEATGKVQTCVATDPNFIEDNMNECPTIAEYQIKMTGTNGEHCIICNLFHTILKAVQNLAQKAYDALAPSLISLLGIGFGIYIGYITLLAVATPGVQKISQYLTNLTTQGFKVAIAIILLSTPSFIYGTIIGPMIDGGVDFGITLAGSDKAQIQEMGSKFDFDAGNTYLQTSVLQNTIGAAVAFNQQAAMVPAIGRSMMCNSWYNDESLIEKISKAHFFPRIPLFTEGLILYIFGLMIAFAVGFYMIDCALQLGVVCAMMPFFVASWPFKITKSYTKQGWDIFLNTFFNFVVMGVVISATSQIMVEALGTGLSQQTLSSLLDTNQVDELMNEIEFGGLQMAMLVICCLLALKLSGEIQNITNKLSGGLGISVGAGLGGALGTSIQKGTMAAAGAAGVAAVATGGRIAESSGIAGAVRSMKGDAKDTATAAAGAAGIGSQAQQGSVGRDHGQNQQFGETGGNNNSGDEAEESPDDEGNNNG